MRSVTFRAFGHENIIGDHKTTLELTSESFLTKRGTCIIGINSDMTLDRFDDDIKLLATSQDTEIQLTISIDGHTTVITGHGSTGLTYSNNVSMVVRTSSFECPRTLMVGADKAASDIDREIITLLRDPEREIHCKISYIKQ